VSFVDLHFHLLPAVDDGPSSIEQSIELARASVADGTGTVVATPHVHPQHISAPREIAARVAELVARLRREQIPLEVVTGGELAMTAADPLAHAELESIAQGPPGARWLLLEAPFDGLDERYTAVADELRLQGFEILVAHPERALWTRVTDAVLLHELRSGSALQLTSGSLVGEFGEPERGRALQLLGSTPRVVIASDAHGETRMPSLTAAVDALRGEGIAEPERFVEAYPRALLERGLTAAWGASEDAA
jgi:protein-tyrosine phosphatase